MGRDDIERCCDHGNDLHSHSIIAPITSITQLPQQKCITHRPLGVLDAKGRGRCAQALSLTTVSN
jgi:hypothetical protein